MKVYVQQVVPSFVSQKLQAKACDYNEHHLGLKKLFCTYKKF